MISQPMQSPPPVGYPQAPIQQYQVPPQPQTTYAGFWIRLAARFVDGIIVGIPLTIVFFVIATVGGAGLSATSNADENTQNAAAGAFAGGLLLFYVIALVAVAGYQIYFWGTSGQTIAMRLFHLRVVDATTGAPIGIGRAVVRWLMTIVNSWACYVGWIWVAFDARKQGWHDKVASSVVLQTP